MRSNGLYSRAGFSTDETAFLIENTSLTNVGDLFRSEYDSQGSLYSDGLASFARMIETSSDITSLGFLDSALLFERMHLDIEALKFKKIALNLIANKVANDFYYKEFPHLPNHQSLDLETLYYAAKNSPVFFEVLITNQSFFLSDREIIIAKDLVQQKVDRCKEVLQCENTFKFYDELHIYALALCDKIHDLELHPSTIKLIKHCCRLHGKTHPHDVAELRSTRDKLYLNLVDQYNDSLRSGEVRTLDTAHLHGVKIYPAVKELSSVSQTDRDLLIDTMAEKLIQTRISKEFIDKFREEDSVRASKEFIFAYQRLERGLALYDSEKLADKIKGVGAVLEFVSLFARILGGR